METFVFIYGILLIATFSMMSLQSYNEYINKKDNIAAFVIFIIIDVVTIVLFVLHFLKQRHMKIMTPRQKAIDIVHKISKFETDAPIQISVIFVNEMINYGYDTTYWQKVKLELNMLM